MSTTSVPGQMKEMLAGDEYDHVHKKTPAQGYRWNQYPTDGAEIELSVMSGAFACQVPYNRGPVSIHS